MSMCIVVVIVVDKFVSFIFFVESVNLSPLALIFPTVARPIFPTLAHSHQPKLKDIHLRLSILCGQAYNFESFVELLSFSRRSTPMIHIVNNNKWDDTI